MLTTKPGWTIKPNKMLIRAQLVCCYWCISILIIISVVRYVPPWVLINRLLCCLIVGIQASGMSIPLSLLMLSGWSLICFKKQKRVVNKCMRLHTTLRHSPFIRFFNLLWNRTCIKEEFNFSMKIIKCFSVVKLLERYVKGEHESRPKRKTRSTRESNLLRRENTSKESFASCNSWYCKTRFQNLSLKITPLSNFEQTHRINFWGEGINSWMKQRGI